ncbi:MAG: putative baseplate assembly protein [Gemmatimonadales bacterium]
MPFRVPALDDRSYDDLVEELVGRIPAHTPEWTNVRKGDPGDTINRCTAWLIDTMLYRANLIPERQRLVFLQRLGLPMRSARPARGLVSVVLDEDTATDAVALAPLANLPGPVPFESRNEVTVLPLRMEAYCKRRLLAEEKEGLAQVMDGLRTVYQVPQVEPYATTPVFPDGAYTAAGFDLIQETVDQSLWLALLAKSADLVDPIRETLGHSGTGGQQLLSIGIAPALEVPELAEEPSRRPRVPHTWEVSFRRNGAGQADYLTLDVISDSTGGLTRQGVLRLALPEKRFIGTPEDNPRVLLDAGVGDQPPRLDVPEKVGRLVCWIRLRPLERMSSLRLSWVGVNAVEIDQRQTLFGRVLGKSDGSPGQVFQLPGTAVEEETLVIEVEEAGLGFQPWRRTEDLALEGRDAHAFVVDAEAGTIRLGDRIHGRSPDPGMLVRLAFGRFGGGDAGNLPPGTLGKISAKGPNGQPVTRKLTVEQRLPTIWGARGEQLAEAETRLASWLRHQNRAVTAEDYRRLAAETPGVQLGRVEVLPRFKPQQRQTDVPGVVSVMVLPIHPLPVPPYPRPDRPTIEAVYNYLDSRRAVGTEMYVIGCRYVALGVAVGVAIREGHEREATLTAVRDALRIVIWSLPPGGPDGGGWPLGRSVSERELEVAVARVPGVKEVQGVKLFAQRQQDWSPVTPAADGAVRLALQSWELPELLSLVVLDGPAPDDLRNAPNPFADPSGAPAVPVPVVLEVC